jgi:hypothetical protein
MDDQDRQVLDAAIDRATDELLDDDLPAFGGEGQLRGLLFGQLNRFGRYWRRPSNCIFPGCGNRSIRASHTIQESALRLIAENGMLMTPSFDLSRGQPIIREVGVGEAGTFPGFCDQHERVFAEFEQRGGVRTGRHAELQLFRTVARELVAKRREVQHFDAIIAAKERLLHAHLLQRICAHVDTGFLARNPDLKVTATEKVSSRLDNFKELRRRRAADLHFIETELYPQAAEALDGRESGLPWVKGTLKVKGTMGVKTMGPMLPLALAGLASFHVDRHGVSEEVQLVVHAVPGADSTDFMVANRWAQEDCFGVVLQSDPPTPERMLALVEGWMIYGTDNWFITPSAWNSLPQPLQDRILRECWEGPSHNCFRLDYSIFDADASRKAAG